MHIATCSASNRVAAEVVDNIADKGGGGGGGGLHKGIFWSPTKRFYFLQVNNLTCVLYPGIPVLAHNNGCFRARAP